MIQTEASCMKRLQQWKIESALLLELTHLKDKSVRAATVVAFFRKNVH